MRYIDIHCHLNMEKFSIDYKDVIQRAQEKEIGIIVVGTCTEDSKKAVEIAEQYENIWAVIGAHPVDAENEEFNLDLYKEMARHKKVVAIGECGLDYFHGGFDKREKQKEIFEKQIAIANEVRKPLMLHIRNGLQKEENAYVDAIEIIKKHAKVSGDVHFFAGNLEEAKQFIHLGFRLSFTGVITFARDYDEVIKNIPLNMIMSETDAPLVAPIPYRGTRNEPSYIIEIVNKIADIRGEDREIVRAHLVDNARKLFSI